MKCCWHIHYDVHTEGTDAVVDKQGRHGVGACDEEAWTRESFITI